jgi:hypothetical protein
MGAGIIGFLDLLFSISKAEFKKNSEYFTSTKFDLYDREETEDKFSFSIKHDLFLHNYGNFLIEFYKSINEDMSESLGFDENSELLKITQFDQFLHSFSGSVSVSLT